MQKITDLDQFINIPCSTNENVSDAPKQLFLEHNDTNNSDGSPGASGLTSMSGKSCH